MFVEPAIAPSGARILRRPVVCDQGKATDDDEASQAVDEHHGDDDERNGIDDLARPGAGRREITLDERCGDDLMAESSWLAPTMRELSSIRHHSRRRWDRSIPRVGAESHSSHKPHPDHPHSVAACCGTSNRSLQSFELFSLS